MKKPPLLLRVGVLVMFVLLITGFIAYRTNKLDKYVYPKNNSELLLANSINTEHLQTDTPGVTTLTYEQQQRKWLLDSLYENDSIYRAATLRAMSSKTMVLPNQSYFKKVDQHIDSIIKQQKSADVKTPK